ncbi:hypothetical protein D9Q98_004176 [Chlorella vulgaris]|uniref:Uncharacterized protein n=1 Tax=Chlorella vulgaris TaxID=3077 RepID=A0A9D4TRU9_CHLVU|nr:hypothetical protein D9Q98_004176 [Chlorella vulgaris]
MHCEEVPTNQFWARFCQGISTVGISTMLHFAALPAAVVLGVGLGTTHERTRVRKLARHWASSAMDLD